TATGAWSGGRATSGSTGVSPSTTSTYGMSCTGSGGSVSRSVSISVMPAPTLNFNGPTSLGAGQTGTLTWPAANATSCTATGAWSGGRATSGSTGVSPST